MAKPVSNKVILAEIKLELRKHPGDAPWSCVDCYHGRPCVEQAILWAAKETVLRRML